jgi:uncharacterized protein
LLKNFGLKMKPPHSDKKYEQAGLRINISKLSDGIHEYKFKVEPRQLGLDERFNKPLNVNARLDKATNKIFLTSDLETDADVECDRCLNPFLHHLQTSYNVLYTYEDRDITVNDSDDVQVISIDKVYLDLAEDVRQYLLLAMPIKLVCKDECAGLCPTCGKNLNDIKCNCKTEEDR